MFIRLRLPLFGSRVTLFGSRLLRDDFIEQISHPDVFFFRHGDSPFIDRLTLDASRNPPGISSPPIESAKPQRHPTDRTI
ncbi:MAG TPA: hypothetical protein VF751_00095, partial [Chthoniobacterales bacterium]